MGGRADGRTDRLNKTEDIRDGKQIQYKVVADTVIINGVKGSVKSFSSNII